MELLSPTWKKLQKQITKNQAADKSGFSFQLKYIILYQESILAKVFNIFRQGA